MAEVDTSIYGNIAKPTNPLAFAGTAAQTINALNQNRLFGQTFAARQAIGQAYENSIDPATGQLDTNKLLANVAHDPRAAFMAGDVAQQALARQQAQTAITGQQLEQATSRYKAFNSVVSPLLAKGVNVTSKDVTSAMTDLVSHGILTPQQATRAIANMPDGGAPLANWVQQHALQAMSAGERFQAIYGTPQAINTGGQTNLVAVSPMTGARSLGTLNNTLSPGEAAAPTPVLIRNPDGTYSPSNVTRSQFVGMANQGPVATGVPLSKAGLPPEVATTPTATFQNGQPGVVPREQFAEQSMAKPATAAAATGGQFDNVRLSPAQVAEITGKPVAGAPSSAAPSGIPGFMPTGPKLGAEAAANVQAHESAEQGVNLQKAADTVPAQKAILGNLESDLNNFTSGPGADWTKVAKAWTNRNIPLPAGMQFDPKSIASQDEFAKQAFQLAQQQFQTLGGTGTDSKLDSTMHTSPNEFLSDLGNRGIIALLKGNADAVAVKNREWQAWLQAGNGPETYGQFSTQFNKEFDPRVFQMVYLSPADRQSMIKGMSKNELSQFRADVNLAVRDGWIPNPNGQQAANGGQ